MRYATIKVSISFDNDENQEDPLFEGMDFEDEIEAQIDPKNPGDMSAINDIISYIWDNMGGCPDLEDAVNQALAEAEKKE